MSHLDEFRKCYDDTKALTIAEWRDIVRSGNTGQFTQQGLQCFQRQPILSGTDSCPYSIECYKLCPLTLEACDGNTEVFEQLLVPVQNLNNQGLLQDVLNESLAMVMRTHSLDLMRYLLNKGASANAFSPITRGNVLSAICGDYGVDENDNIKIAELLVQHGAKDLSGAMCGASYNYRVRLLQYLLDAGAPANGYQIIGPITRAGFNDQYRVPQILLEHGADPNYTGTMGCTPMLWAAFHGATNTVKLLLMYGADPEPEAGICLDSNVPLVIACLRDYVTIVALLIQAFCDVNRPGKMLDRNLKSSLRHHFGSKFKGMQLTALEALCLSSEKPHYPSIANLLLAAGGKLRKSVLKLDHFQPHDLFVRLQEQFSRPSSLLLLCRVAIRKCLKGKRNYMVQQQLPLPKSLLSYILMLEDIEPFVKNLQHFDVVQYTSNTQIINVKQE